ncbi:glycosyltransferase family 34 protein [Patellaria atrata CBS 101060]|uniref:Glycosyltransferase family 34 protein n=1 Tax=Patellaria atrata CBS 101060 TaxID=1346257 RepID=A0A9P4SA77_9PEZI|nr:glycosyltransferase family 34 protein [Patellaria atrata CBS 101060]
MGVIALWTYLRAQSNSADIIIPDQSKPEIPVNLQQPVVEDEPVVENTPVHENQEPPVSADTEVIEVATTSSVAEAAVSTPTTQPVVGKITISFGGPDPCYDRAIESHNLHNQIHGYPEFVLRERLLSGLWSKHAYILHIITEELAKPEDQRLQWVWWFDRDTVITNPLMPLEAFIPPQADFSHIYLLATNDRHGLNNGVFMLRVNDWALKLFAHALAFHHFRPDVDLKYTEQSAMEEMLKVPWYKRSTVIVPQRWFNAYPPPEEQGARLKPNHARPGSLLIHFASNRDGLRPERMGRWMDVVDQRTERLEVPYNETGYPDEIEEFWARLRAGEDELKVGEDIGKSEWESVMKEREEKGR